MRRNTTLVIWLCGVALIVTLLMQCPHGRIDGTRTITTSDTIIKNVYMTDTLEIKTTGGIIHDTTFLPIPVNVDTAAIIRDYFTQYVASDTLIDTNLYALIIDTISGNRITGRSFSYRWLKPTTTTTIINNTTIINSKARLYLGINFSYINNNPGITPSLLFCPKESKHGFSFGFDILNKGMIGGYHYNILKP